MAIDENKVVLEKNGIIDDKSNLGGENDVIFSAENFRILAEKIPGANLHIFKDAPHVFTREKEDQVVTVI